MARRGEGSTLGIMHDIFGTVFPAMADAAEDDAGAAAVLALAALMASMSIISGAAAAAPDACGTATRTRPAPPAAAIVAAVDRSASRRLNTSPDNAAARGNKRISGARRTSIMFEGRKGTYMHVKSTRPVPQSNHLCLKADRKIG